MAENQRDGAPIPSRKPAARQPKRSNFQLSTVRFVSPQPTLQPQSKRGHPAAACEKASRCSDFLRESEETHGHLNRLQPSACVQLLTWLMGPGSLQDVLLNDKNPTPRREVSLFARNTTKADTFKDIKEEVKQVVET